MKLLEKQEAIEREEQEKLKTMKTSKFIIIVQIKINNEFDIYRADDDGYSSMLCHIPVNEKNKKEIASKIRNGEFKVHIVDRVGLKYLYDSNLEEFFEYADEE